MLQRHVLLNALLRSPPSLRSEILRQALSSPAGTGGLNILGRGLRTARGHHRPPTPLIKRHTGLLDRRSQSTTSFNPTVASTPDRPPPPPSQGRSRAFRFLTTTALSLVLFAAGLAMSAAPATETINGYVHPPTDAETLHLYHPATPREQEIDDHILTHPLAIATRNQPGMSESRPHMRIPPAMRPHNLTGGVLTGQGRIEVPPLNFNEKHAELPSMVQIMFLGESLCGHPGIVHGGLLATMLDEGLARACFPALPNKIGVTASLKIDYRVPCPAGSYVVLKAYTEKVEGRKAWVKGWIELLGEEEGTGVKVVEAEALFIEPRNAANMAKNIVASD